MISDATWRKGEGLHASYGVRPDPEQSSVFWVRGSTGREYRVQLYESHATCSCPHGRNTANAVCYHVAAAHIEKEKERDHGGREPGRRDG